ncbi:MAG: rhodanese-like domain-containing protein [Velocimicrobium sp.]
MAFFVVSANEIKPYIGKAGTLVVDLRDKDSFKKAHIATAINIPYEDFLGEESIRANYSTIIFYCERGNSSLLVARDYKDIAPLVLALAGGFNRNKTKFMIDGMG